jgi:hypothetical protein
MEKTEVIGACDSNGFHVRWVPVTTAWRVLRLWMKESPPAMKSSCEYIEKTVADK